MSEEKQQIEGVAKVGLFILGIPAMVVFFLLKGRSWRLQIPTFVILAVLFLLIGSESIIRYNKQTQTTFYVLIWVSLLGLLGCIGAIINKSLSGPGDTATLHGSAQWGNPKKFVEWRVPADAPVVGGGLALAPLSKRERLEIPRGEIVQHVVVLGPPGTGKSRSIFIPAAATAKGSSIVATDPKSELWQYTSGYHERPVRLAPTEPEASACWNPIPDCKDERVADLLAHALVESGQTSRTDQFWLDNEVNLCAAIFSHAAHAPEPTLASTYAFLTSCRDFETMVDRLLESPSQHARSCAGILMMTDAKIKGSILPGIASKLKFLDDPKVKRFTSASLTPFDFSVLKRLPTALYWCLPERDIPRLRPLTSMFFTKLFDDLGGEANPYSGQAQESSEQGNVPVTVLADEFANIGKVPNFDSVITLARSKNVALVLGIQSLAQLDLRYGREAARVILDSCATKIVLHGLDSDSAERISRTLGDQTHVINRRSVSRRSFLESPTVTSNQTEHGRRLLQANEIRQIGQDQMIVISGNRSPLWLHKYHWDQPPCTATARSLGEAQVAKFSMPERKKKPQLPPPLPPSSN